MSQSPVFKAMFDTDSKEKEENVVIIKDSTKDALQAFLDYLYNIWREECSSPNLELTFGLLNLANKYQVDQLLHGCMDTLLEIMDNGNVLKIMAVVDKFELGSDMTDMVMKFIKEKIKVVAKNEDWAAFLSDHPSLVADLVLDMRQDIKGLKNKLGNEVSSEESSSDSGDDS